MYHSIDRIRRFCIGDQAIEKLHELEKLLEYFVSKYDLFYKTNELRTGMTVVMDNTLVYPSAEWLHEDFGITIMVEPETLEWNVNCSGIYNYNDDIEEFESSSIEEVADFAIDYIKKQYELEAENDY